MATPKHLSMDFYQNQVSGIHLHLHWIEMKNPPKSICYCSFNQNKSCSHSAQIVTIRNSYTMNIDAISVPCSKYSLEDTHTYVPSGSTFQPNQNARVTGLSFINTLCIRSERCFPILMENIKNHQISGPIGPIGFSSFDVVDGDERKYQIRNAYELTSTIISADERYNDCFFLHSTVPAQSTDENQQIIHGHEDSILQLPNSIGHCISANARMSESFADFPSREFLVSGQSAAQQSSSCDMGTIFGNQQEGVIPRTL